MAQNVTQINTAADTWQTVIDRLNLIANLTSNVIVTANADANGALTTGNAYVNGVVAAARMSTLELRGGNVQASASLWVSTNASIGNSTANIVFTPNTLELGNSTVNVAINTSAILFGGNLELNETSFSVGNSTINTSANSSALISGDLSLRTNVSVGANVYLTTGDFFIGNSTANTTANSITITSGQIDLRTAVNVGANVNLNTGTLTIGNSTINTTANSSVVNSGTVNLRTGLNVGSNVILTTSRVTVGNSTVNVFINSTHLTIGPTIVNSSGGTFGATFTVNTNLLIGNSTVNVAINSSSLLISGNLFANSSAYQVGNSTVNSLINATTINTGTLNLRTGANVGANVRLSNTTLVVGNATVNTVINSSAVTIVGSVNPSVAVNVGANVRLTTGSLLIGNSSVNVFANSSTVAAGNVTARDEVRVSTGGQNVVINALAMRVWGTVVNAIYDNSLIRIDDGDLYCLLQRNNLTFGNTAGTNTFITRTSVDTGDLFARDTIKIGTATQNVSMNASTITNWGGTANIQIGSATIILGETGTNNTNITRNSLTIGNTTTNTTIARTGVTVGGNAMLTSTGFNVGNSSINAIANSTSLRLRTAVQDMILDPTYTGGIQKNSYPVAPVFVVQSVGNFSLTTDGTYTAVLNSPTTLPEGWYRIEGVIFVNSTSATGIKTRFAGSGAGTVHGTWIGMNMNGGTYIENIEAWNDTMTTGNYQFLNGSVNDWYLRFNGSVKITSIGTFNMHFGQAVANATTTTIRLGSYMSIQKMDGIT